MNVAEWDKRVYEMEKEGKKAFIAILCRCGRSELNCSCEQPCADCVEAGKATTEDYIRIHGLEGTSVWMYGQLTDINEGL
ncbi:hypothetical protein LCGC14_1164950 [marine sediment metagenome]|uniref:Uncharacterized protein n=1 Tax=marine sediment metagenome TaxID=412755 RepID=A0A0F9PX28_9ZZZZ